MDKSQTFAARVHVSTGYTPGEGNRRASRNGPVSDLPPEIPHVSIRNFFTALQRGALAGGSLPTPSGRRSYTDLYS
jgi:hypothetical protein